jgi:hypothetical protein
MYTERRKHDFAETKLSFQLDCVWEMSVRMCLYVCVAYLPASCVPFQSPLDPSRTPKYHQAPIPFVHFIQLTHFLFASTHATHTLSHHHMHAHNELDNKQT